MVLAMCAPVAAWPSDPVPLSSHDFTPRGRACGGFQACNHWTAAVSAAIPVGAIEPSHIAGTLADMDGDGDQDLVMAVVVTDEQRSTAHLHWARHAPGAAWTVLSLRADVPTTDAPVAVFVGDVDGDGDGDVVWSLGGGCGALEWLENVAGDGAAWKLHAIAPPAVDCAVQRGAAVAAADMDGDGDLDIVAAGRPHAVTLLENAGAGAAWVPHAISDAAQRFEGVHVADVDGDGDADVLAWAADGSVQWFATAPRLRGVGSVWATHDVPAHGVAAPAGALVADFDGDGDSDVLLLRAGAAGTALWLEGVDAAAGAWREHRHPLRLPPSAALAAAVDVDGDGRTDVVHAGAGSGVAWLASAGTPLWAAVSAEGPALAAAAAPPRLLLAGDADGDGDVDVVTVASLPGALQLALHTCAAPRCAPGCLHVAPHRCAAAAPAAVAIAGAAAAADGMARMLDASDACPAGWVRATPASECTACPAGTVARNGTSCQLCGPGTSTPGAGATVCEQCPLERTCLVGACAWGSSGALCAECDEGFYQYSGECRKCPKLSGVEIGIGVLVFAILAFVMYKRGPAVRRESSSILREMVSNSQYLGIMFSVSIAWPSFVTEAYRWVRTACGDIMMFSPRCFASYTWHGGFVSSLALVALVVAVILTICQFIKRSAEKHQQAASVSHESDESDDAKRPLTAEQRADMRAARLRHSMRADKLLMRRLRVMSVLVLVGVVTYVPLMRLWTQPFECADTSFGRRLKVDVRIRCNSVEHVAVQVASGALLLAGLLLPAWLWYRMRKSVQLPTGGFAEESALLFLLREAYSDRFPYLELALLLRKGFSLLFIALVPSVLAQHVFLLVLALAHFMCLWRLRPWRARELNLCNRRFTDVMNRLALAATFTQCLALVAAILIHQLPSNARFLGVVVVALASVVALLYLTVWLYFSFLSRTASSSGEKSALQLIQDARDALERMSEVSSGDKVVELNKAVSACLAFERLVQSELAVVRSRVAYQREVFNRMELTEQARAGHEMRHLNQKLDALISIDLATSQSNGSSQQRQSWNDTDARLKLSATQTKARMSESIAALEGAIAVSRADNGFGSVSRDIVKLWQTAELRCALHLAALTEQYEWYLRIMKAEKAVELRRDGFKVQKTLQSLQVGAEEQEQLQVWQRACANRLSTFIGEHALPQLQSYFAEEESYRRNAKAFINPIQEVESAQLSFQRQQLLLLELENMLTEELWNRLKQLAAPPAALGLRGLIVHSIYVLRARYVQPLQEEFAAAPALPSNFVRPDRQALDQELDRLEQKMANMQQGIGEWVAEDDLPKRMRESFIKRGRAMEEYLQRCEEAIKTYLDYRHFAEAKQVLLSRGAILDKYHSERPRK